MRANSHKIISVELIVHGALLVQDPENLDDYLVVDTVDRDMFLQMQNLVF